MYGNATLRQIATTDGPSPTTAITAPIRRPRDILGKRRVTLGWLIWQVAREEITPSEAAWALCPNVEPMSSGFIKLLGHTELTFRSWLGFYQECGADKGQECAVKKEIMRIWGLKESDPCHLLPRK